MVLHLICDVTHHLFVHFIFSFVAAGASAAPGAAPPPNQQPYESRVGMKHWSVNQTTIPGLLLDLSENGGSAQLSGDEIAETVLDIIRRKFIHNNSGAYGRVISLILSIVPVLALDVRWCLFMNDSLFALH